MTSYPPSGDGDQGRGGGAYGDAGQSGYGRPPQQPGYPPQQPGYPQGGGPGGPPPYTGQPGFPGPYPGDRGGPGAAATTPGGFFGALFDFRFDRFATPSVIKVLYIIGMALIGVAFLFVVGSGFLQGVGFGLLALILGAVGALFYLILLRVTLEFYYAVVRMSEDIHHRR